MQQDLNSPGAVLAAAVFVPRPPDAPWFACSQHNITIKQIRAPVGAMLRVLECIDTFVIRHRTDPKTADRSS
jgi:class 3 adenylate cyclase